MDGYSSSKKVGVKMYIDAVSLGGSWGSWAIRLRSSSTDKYVTLIRQGISSDDRY